jgi:hypothetical protein
MFLQTTQMFQPYCRVQNSIRRETIILQEGGQGMARVLIQSDSLFIIIKILRSFKIVLSVGPLPRHGRGAEAYQDTKNRC